MFPFFSLKSPACGPLSLQTAIPTVGVPEEARRTSCWSLHFFSALEGFGSYLLWRNNPGLYDLEVLLGSISAVAAYQHHWLKGHLRKEVGRGHQVVRSVQHLPFSPQPMPLTSKQRHRVSLLRIPHRFIYGYPVR